MTLFSSTDTNMRLFAYETCLRYQLTFFSKCMLRLSSNLQIKNCIGKYKLFFKVVCVYF